MNKHSLFLLSLFALVGAAASASTNAQTDCLSFRDGDVLYGKLLQIEPGPGVRWQHPDALEPADFKLDSVSQIDFSPRRSSANHDDSSCKLWLANGDLLAGKLVSFDTNALSLDTWYAGPLKIPRRALQTLSLASRVPVIFEGPTGLDGWTEGSAVKGFVGESGQWVYRNGAFYSDKASSIARDIKLPDQAQLQFDMVWRGPLGLAIALYSDSLQPILLTDKENGPDFGAFYSLRFQNTVFVSLTPIRKKDPLRSLGDSLIIQSLTQKDRVHVDLRMSKGDRRVALFLDGGLVKDWIDPGGFAGDGTGIRIVNNQAGSAVKISNIRVTKWNGMMEDAAAVEDAAAESPDPSHDVVLLESGGKVSGAVTGIANGQISMQTTGGATNVPLADVSAIDFAPYQGSHTAAAAANARAGFVRGGSVTFQLLDWQPGGIAALSPDFGKVTFDPAAFGSLQFLPAETKKAPIP
ncbi:MAG TPA: hypothetical protein VGO59_02865 [Verrucomicrobiae bacterium]|jgi:hypothetical protein